MSTPRSTSNERCRRARGARPRDGLRVLGMRFTGDLAVPAERFAHLREAFGASFEAIEIDSAAGNAAAVPQDAHSVVTEHLFEEPRHPTRVARDRVLAFFGEQLR